MTISELNTGQLGRDKVGRDWRLSACTVVVLGLILGSLPARVFAGADDAPSEPTSVLSLDRVFAEPSLFGSSPSLPQWSADSRHFAFIWQQAELAQRGLWVGAVDGSRPRHLFGGQPGSATVREVVWLPDGTAVLSLCGDALWLTDVRAGASRRVAQLAVGASGLGVSPDGRHAVWLQQGDLWRLSLASATPERLTDLGLPPLSSLPAGRYRRAEREIGPGIWGGPTYRWAPGGRYVAVHAVDRRQMRKVPFPDYTAAETAPNEVRRGYPGDANERREVGILDLQEGSLRWLALPDPAAHQIVDFAWSRDQRLLVDVASDTAVDRQLYVADAATATPRLLWHSERQSRIYTSFAAHWFPDNSAALVLSDHEDRYGLYRIDLASALAGAGEAMPIRLSDPHHDVLGDIQFNSSGDALFYAATGDTPADRQLFRVQLRGAAPVADTVDTAVLSDASEAISPARSGSASVGPVRALTRHPGQHEAVVSPDGSHLVLRSSNDRSPPDLYLLSATAVPASAEDAAQQVKRLTHSPPPEFDQYPWAEVRYLNFPSRIDDYTLSARLMVPPDFDPSRPYPVIFGPLYSNTVRNRWAGVYTAMQQLLVQRGFLVLQVDVRGSTGYGRAFREAFLTDFAGDDIEDLHSAVEYLQTQPWADTQRLGLWGSSYGGTLTVYTLLNKPGLFKAGVAAASAVDPRFFGTDDVAIVRRPDTHPQIFARRAADLAANLEGALLLIHGMQDQVVPFKTIADLTEALIREGKDFDTAFVPGATHAWSREPGYDRYLFGRLLTHFERHLKP